MKRDFSTLESGRFDVLVIGGGIYGAWTAYDAALRGLRTAVVEQTDWAAGTSSASTKLIHGGLRYLEQLRLGLVRVSLQERKLLASLAPHRVSPLRFYVPAYRWGRAGRLRLRAGLSLYDRLAGPGQPVARHEWLTAGQLLAACPCLAGDGLRGGFGFGDCWTDDARFTLEIVDGAVSAGAAAVNYAPAERLLESRGRVYGAAVRDVLSGRTVEVEASVVVNCGGAWIQGLSPAGAERVPLRRTKGVHLAMPALPVEHAILLTTRSDKRVLFMIPWYGRTLVGTTDTDYAGDPGDVKVEPADADYLLSEANRYLHGLTWDESHICGSFAGLRALRDGTRREDSSVVSREWQLFEPMAGYLVSVGGKFTTARREAERIVNRVLEITRRPGGGRTPTRSRPFPWSPGEPFPSWRQRMIQEARSRGFDEKTASTLTRRYGTRMEAVLNCADRVPDLARRIVPELPFAGAEVVYAAGQEMAVTLEDIVRRRIPLTILHRLSAGTLDEIAATAAPGLGWSLEARTAQVRSLTGPPEESGQADRRNDS